MSFSPLRFIHASDFQLHQPLAGFAHAPDDMRQMLVEAPMAAARAVFDAAIVNSVDFLILSGGLIDIPRAAPASVRLLIDQFKRLADKDIRIYWAGSTTDGPDKWPGGLPLPENVQRLSARQSRKRDARSRRTPHRQHCRREHNNRPHSHGRVSGRSRWAVHRRRRQW